MKQKVIFAAALLLLTAPVLTACAGTDGSSASVQDSGSQQNAGDPADLKTAGKTLDRFLDACKDHDTDEMKQFSNLDRIPQFAAVMGYPPTDEEGAAQIERAVETYCNLDKFSVSNGQFNQAATDTYSGYFSDMPSVAEGLNQLDENQSQILSAADSLFFPIDKVYSFDVEVTANGEKKVDKMYVIHSETDGWRLDVGQLQSMVDYMSASKVKIVNQYAKEASTAANTALTDMDAEDLDIRKLDGQYTFKGSEFSESGSDPAAVLKGRMLSLMSDLAEMDFVCLQMEKGELKGLAVQKSFGEYPYYGTWPTVINEHDMYYFSGIDDAIKYAAGSFEFDAPF